RPDRGEPLRRVPGQDAALDAGEACGRREGPREMKVAVVGGGLAGLAAALELVDAGQEVVLHEARPTLGGAVQTLPERDGEPEPGETFGHLLRRLGASDAAIERFWDVFIRPALNLPADEVDAGAGLFTVRTALLGPRANSDLVLPTRPLGAMHGDAAGRVLGERVRLESRVESLDELDADAIVVATPPAESARLLGEV